MYTYIFIITIQDALMGHRSASAPFKQSKFKKIPLADFTNKFISMNEKYLQDTLHIALQSRLNNTVPRLTNNKTVKRLLWKHKKLFFLYKQNATYVCFTQRLYIKIYIQSVG